jgi:hypothetical protein
LGVQAALLGPEAKQRLCSHGRQRLGLGLGLSWVRVEVRQVSRPRVRVWVP